MRREIAHLIETVVRERFSDVDIEAIRVSEETDYDGDPVFRVTVVCDGPLNLRRATGLTRHLRHRLLDAEEKAFPIFAFISKADAAGMSPEAA